MLQPIFYRCWQRMKTTFHISKTMLQHVSSNDVKYENYQYNNAVMYDTDDRYNVAVMYKTHNRNINDN